MKNAHFETDAQNWHIIGTELVSFIYFWLIFYPVQQQIRKERPQVSESLPQTAKSLMARLFTQRHPDLLKEDELATKRV